MASKLKVVGETEVPDPQPAPQAALTPPPTAPQSKPSSPSSPHLLMLLDEIRRVLNARMGALLAMIGAFLLTTVAMVQGTWMSLAISVSYDLLIFVPIALIAYRVPKS